MNKTFNTYTLLAPSTFSAFSLRDSVTRWIIFKGLNIFFSVPSLSALQGKCARINWVTGGFRYDFTESQAPSCKLFPCQNRRFRVFKAVYWKDFQNWSVISPKEQAKEAKEFDFIIN
jgi:hypothetical protein